MSDEFFDDEQSLMNKGSEEQDLASSGSQPEPHAEPASSSKASGKSSLKPVSSAPQKTASLSAPPFWTVLLITLIALVLGVIVGWFLGASSAYSSLSNMQDSAVQQQYATGSSSTQDTSSILPEGHPQLNIAEDGTASVAQQNGSSQAQ